MASPGTRIGSVAAFASAEPEGGGNDDAPSSETRPLDGGRPRMLRVFMCLRGSDPAERAWLTVTDEAGATLFEGWLSIDDAVEVEVANPGAPTQARLVRLLLETERWHRQAHLTLSEDLTEHVFV